MGRIDRPTEEDQDVLRSQKINLRMSELRTELRSLADLDSLTAEQATKTTELRNELDDNETRYRAALAGEVSVAGQDKRTTATDAEGVEFRALMRRSQVSRYIGSALAGQAITGAEAEAAQAVNLIGPEVAIPWAVLAGDALEPRTEFRTDAATSLATGVEQETTSVPILDRVFRRSAALFMGVVPENVPVGDHSYVSLSGGQSTGPEFVAAGAAKDAEAFTLSAATVAPKRISGRFLFRVEDAARLGDYEAALRRDLIAHLSDVLDNETIAGDGQDEHLTGLISSVPNANTVAVTTTIHTATHWLADLAAAVDGYFATSAMDVRALLGPASYKAILSVSTINYPAVAGLLSEVVNRASGGMRASAFIPAPSSNGQSNLFCGTGSGKRLATAPIWEGIRVIRDEFTLAHKGEIAVTARMLCGLVVHRPSAFYLRGAKLA